MISYQPGKANILTDALSRSKRVEPDADTITTVEETDQAQEVSMMTRSGIIASEEEIKEWQSAQESDPAVRDTIERVKQR